jgi:WD40 repeat protein
MMQDVRDGKFMVIAGQDKIIRLINMLTFMLSDRLAGRSQETADMAFIVAHLLSASGDSTVRVWDMPTGRCLPWMKFSTLAMTMTRASSCELRRPTERASTCSSTSRSTRACTFVYVPRAHGRQQPPGQPVGTRHQ